MTCQNCKRIAEIIDDVTEARDDERAEPPLWIDEIYKLATEPSEEGGDAALSKHPLTKPLRGGGTAHPATPESMDSRIEKCAEEIYVIV